MKAEIMDKSTITLIPENRQESVLLDYFFLGDDKPFILVPYGLEEYDPPQDECNGIATLGKQEVRS